MVTNKTFLIPDSWFLIPDSWFLIPDSFSAQIDNILPFTTESMDEDAPHDQVFNSVVQIYAFSRMRIAWFDKTTNRISRHC